MAEHLGYTVAKLRSEIDPNEMCSWRAYDAIHGFSTERIVACLCLMGHAICAGLSVKISPEDLYPRFRTAEEQERMRKLKAEAWAATYSVEQPGG